MVSSLVLYVGGRVQWDRGALQTIVRFAEVKSSYVVGGLARHCSRLPYFLSMTEVQQLFLRVVGVLLFWS